MELREITEREFEKFAEGSESDNFLQSVQMFHRYQKRGNEAYLLGLEEKKKLLAVALVVSKRKLLGQKIFNAPRGFLMDYEGAGAARVFGVMTEKVAEFLRGRGGMTLSISPHISRVVETNEEGEVCAEKWEFGEKFTEEARKLGYKPLGEYEFAKWIYTLQMDDLREDTLMKWFRSGHREAIRYATKRYGVRLREISGEELGILDDLAHEAGIRHNFPDPGLRYYQEMEEAFGDKVKFVVAEVPTGVIKAYLEGDKVAMEVARQKAEKSEVDMTPVAAAMFVFWRDRTIYLYSGSKAEYKKFGGPHLIQYEMMKEAIKRKNSLYDFYGVMPLPGDGVYEFKRGFHGQVEEYVGTFMLPLTLKGKLFTLKQRYSEMKDVH